MLKNVILWQNFACPKCKKVYSDSEDKYLNRCNKNKNGCTKIKCDCGQSFYMTYNYKGDAVSFMPYVKPSSKGLGKIY